MDLVSALDFEKAGGFVTAIAQDDATGEVLMVAHMNEEAFRRTLEYCRKNGTVSPDCDPEREAELLLDLIMGISMRTSLDPDRWPTAKQPEHLDAYLKKLI